VKLFPILLILIATHASADDKLDALFSAWQKDTTPGCSAAALLDDEVVYAAAYGMSNLDHQVANTTASIFHVASVSKQFTAAAILLLQQQGKLELDDPVQKYVPELALFASPITIRHLLHHTSGLRDQWELLSLSGWRYGEDLITDQDVLRVLSKQRDLNFEPNSEYMYSNSGYTLLAQIVTRVSGQSLRQFTQQQIFIPLGMTNTFFRDNFREVVPGQAYGYIQDPEAATGFELSVTNFDTVGATSLLTTASDLLKWAARFSSPTPQDALATKMIEQGVLNDGTIIAYAHGLSVGKYRGQKTISHGGADAGYRAYLLSLPDAHLSVSVLCNTPTNTGGLAQQIVDLLIRDQLEPALAAEKPQPSVHVSETTLASYVGRFYYGQEKWLGTASLIDGSLVMQIRNAKFDMVPIATRQFRMDPGGVLAEFANDSSSMTTNFDKPNARIYQRVAGEYPLPQRLAEYVGLYRSDEIEIPFRLHLTSTQRLAVDYLKSSVTELDFATDDVFVTPRVALSFRRNAKGEVVGLQLDTGRIRALKFNKVGD
jgi:CubicO group peptidase (beta-lactamase class C family)